MVPFPTESTARLPGKSRSLIFRFSISSLPRHPSAAWRGERVSSERVELAHPDVFSSSSSFLPWAQIRNHVSQLRVPFRFNLTGVRLLYGRAWFQGRRPTARADSFVDSFSLVGPRGSFSRTPYK